MKEKKLENIAFGKRIAELRHGLQLSQEKLAFECGLDRTYIGHIERGEKSATIVTIEKLAKGLKISKSELFAYDK